MNTAYRIHLSKAFPDHIELEFEEDDTVVFSARLTVIELSEFWGTLTAEVERGGNTVAIQHGGVNYRTRMATPQLEEFAGELIRVITPRARELVLKSLATKTATWKSGDLVFDTIDGKNAEVREVRKFQTEWVYQIQHESAAAARLNLHRFGDRLTARDSIPKTVMRKIGPHGGSAPEYVEPEGGRAAVRVDLPGYSDGITTVTQADDGRFLCSHALSEKLAGPDAEEFIIGDGDSPEDAVSDCVGRVKHVLKDR